MGPGTDPAAAAGSAALEAFARAILNVLEDFADEKGRLADTLKAILNVLDDFGGEKERLEATQKAILNILEDFDAEKRKVASVNLELRREIAERRLAETALIERTDELARSNADLEQFAYVASHDLQEPLRMVSSYVQLLERRYLGQLDAQADKYVRYAVDGAKRMQALIAGLLEYSRLGRSPVSPQPVALERTLDEVLSNLSPLVEETGARITRDALPVGAGDPAQIALVLQNLLANALKFRRPGTTPEIHVSVVRRGDEHVIGVADNGIGIDPEHVDRIFVIFQRLHTQREYPGTGIGLSVCKKVVERHGGRIWVEPAPGGGSVFRFTIPGVPEGLP